MIDRSPMPEKLTEFWNIPRNNFRGHETQSKLTSISFWFRNYKTYVSLLSNFFGGSEINWKVHTNCTLFICYFMLHNHFRVVNVLYDFINRVAPIGWSRCAINRKIIKIINVCVNISVYQCCPNCVSRHISVSPRNFTVPRKML